MFYYKATLENMASGYDPSFHYNMGLNIHPNSDTSSVTCGRGFHLAKTIRYAKNYVNNATEFYLVTAGKILGNDNTKIRSDECNVLLKIPQSIIDAYRAKLKLLDDDYRAKLEPLNDDYEAKRKLLDDTFQAKLEPLDDVYRAKLKPLNDAFQAKWKLLGDAFQAKLKLLDEKTKIEILALYERGKNAAQMETS